jgi:hypothetical protein
MRFRLEFHIDVDLESAVCGIAGDLTGHVGNTRSSIT